MVTITEARQQLETAKKTIEQRKQQEQEAFQQLEEAKTKLPSGTSQMALRKTMAGLAGRERRRQIAARETEIAEKEANVATFGEETKSYEQEIIKQEEQVRAAEAEQALYDKAMRQIQRKAAGKKGSILTTDAERAAFQKILKDNPQIRRALYGGPDYVATLKYGTEAEKERVQKQLFGGLMTTPTDYTKSMGIATQQEVGSWENISLGDMNKIQFTIANPLPEMQVSLREDMTTRVQEGTLLPSVFIKAPTGPTIGERFKEATKDRLVTGTLGFIGGEVERTLSEVPILAEKGTAEFSFPYQTRGTSLYTPDKGFYVEKQQIELPSTAEFIGDVTTVGPYFIPYVGEALLIVGGAEEVIKSPTLTGKALGGLQIGLGTYSAITRVRGAMQTKAIEQAKTGFYAEELPLKSGTSKINIISKTQVGNKPYYGFTRQLIVDNPIDELTKVGASRSLVIEGGGKVYPIDIITPRVQPYKSVFVSREAGGGVKILNTPTIKISQDIGSGVISSSQVIGAYDDVLQSRVVGAFKPSGRSEGLFTFVGGDKPRIITRIGKGGIEKVAKTEENIIGLVKIKTTKPQEFTIGSGTIQKSIFLKPETKIQITEAVASQRAAALGAAKSSIPKSYPLFAGVSATGLNILDTSTKDGLIGGYSVSTRVGSGQLDRDIVRPSGITGGAITDIDQSLSKVETKTQVAPITTETTTTRQKQYPILMPKQEVITIPRQREDVTVITKQTTTPKTELSLKSILRTRQPTKTRTPTTTQPLIKQKVPLVPTKTKESIKGSGRLSTRTRAIFEVLGRRRGKEISLGKYGTQLEAEKGLKQFLKGTLGASGKIKTGERELEFGELSLLKGFEFRPAKRDITRIVQKRGYRLGTSSEIREILSAAKSKKKKARRFKWF